MTSATFLQRPEKSVHEPLKALLLFTVQWHMLHVIYNVASRQNAAIWRS